MGGISLWQLLIVAGLVVLLFGRGKISELMGDVGKGIKSFKSGLKDDGEEEKPAVTQTAERADQAIDVTPQKERKDA